MGFWTKFKTVGSVVGIGAIQGISAAYPLIPPPFNVGVAIGLPLLQGVITKKASEHNPDGYPAEFKFDPITGKSLTEEGSK